MMQNRLRVLRAERRWSQGELARRVNVSRQTIASLENGKFQPSLQLAFRLAHVAGLSVEDIFTPSPEDLVTVDTRG
jgi:putative transcriptional regulator